MAAFETEILVLRTHNLGESDRIVICLSPDRGKFGAVAKGCRRPKSRFAAVAQLFTHSMIQGNTGRNLDIITQAEIVSVFGAIRGDALAMAWAQYAVELVDISTPEHQPLPEVFGELLEHLGRLGNNGDPLVLTRAFELRLLALLGYQPDLTGCPNCGNAPDSGDYALFIPASGGVVCRACADGAGVTGGIKISMGALQYMRTLTRADDKALSAIKMNAAMAGQLEDANLRFLAYHLERLPKSLEFARMISQGG